MHTELNIFFTNLQSMPQYELTGEIEAEYYSNLYEVMSHSPGADFLAILSFIINLDHGAIKFPFSKTMYLPKNGSILHTYLNNFKLKSHKETKRKTP